MNDRHQGGGTAPIESSGHELQAWNDLTDRLAAQLMRMRDESDHLILELPDTEDGGTRPYAQFAGSGDGTLRAELGGNAHLAPAHAVTERQGERLRAKGWRGNDYANPNWYVEHPVGDASTVAAMAVEALQGVFGIAHPQLLTYQAWGSNVDGVGGLGLSATEDVPAEPPSEVLVFQPEDREDLTAMVRMTLHIKYDEEPTIDDDGDVVLTHMGQQVWVHTRHDMPAVEIFACVTHRIHSRRATALEIALLNRDHPLVKWCMRDRAVWQHIVVPALPFVPGHLDTMIDVFLATMTATRDDLALRVGGRVA